MTPDAGRRRDAHPPASVPVNHGSKTRYLPLLETKLRPPPVREGMVFRPALVALLRSGRGRKLTLLSAPTGYGKTTLLAQWRASREETRPFAWISLDAKDNDPLRLTAYVIEAVDRIEPGFGGDLRGLLRTPGIDFDGVLLPGLVNALAALPREVVIVSDDYHLLYRSPESNPTNYILEHMPENVQLVISTRSDPPIPLGRLRASGQMVEIRASELAFDQEEAWALLRNTFGAGLDGGGLDALLRRTEGWPAGLYLAALALGRSSNPNEDVRAFAGDARHVADYLTEEVLERQSPRVRNFLLKTSILDRFTAPLCNTVVGEEGSAELLERLERSNMFLASLDAQREWYRYHHLFAGLLNAELRGRDPASIPELHGRAAAWYLESGSIEDAIHHTLLSGNFQEAGELIVRHWLAFLNHGLRASLRSWLSSIPERHVAGYPPLAVVSAWLAGFEGDMAGVRRWVSVAENGSYAGPMPDGTTSLESAVALLHASFASGNATRAYESARRAIELEARPGSPWRSVPLVTLGCGLYWIGDAAESRRTLEESIRITGDSPMPATARLVAMSYLALLETEEGDPFRAGELAREALDFAGEYGLGNTAQASTAHVAFGMALAGRDRLDEAAGIMERAVALGRLMSEHPGYPHALLACARVRWDLEDHAGARTLYGEASGVIEGYEDPGRRLLSMLDEVGRRLHLASRRQPEAGQELTVQELEVLRLLTGESTRPEIANSLYVSVNTVKSHLRSIYRKLAVSSREAAIEAARRLGIIA